MHKEEKSFVKERKTSSKSSQTNDKKNPENVTNLLSATAKSPSEYMTEYRGWKKHTLQIILLMLSLRDGNLTETLLMTAQINTDLVNHSVPLTIDPSTSLVRVLEH
ncbi:UNVERIFIED_CONTAM: hypothetical protein NCL1_42208 [Trichonephila clavipes]